MASKNILTAHTVASASYWEHAQSHIELRAKFKKQGASYSMARDPNLCQIHQAKCLDPNPSNATLYHQREPSSGLTLVLVRTGLLFHRVIMWPYTSRYPSMSLEWRWRTTSTFYRSSSWLCMTKSALQCNTTGTTSCSSRLLLCWYLRRP